MAKSLLPLITHFIGYISTRHTGVDALIDTRGVNGFESLGQKGTFAPEDVDVIMRGYEDLLSMEGMDRETRESLEPTVNLAIACGTSASAFCAMFRGKDEMNQLATSSPSLSVLKSTVSDRRRRLIRIDLGSHSYVVEQVDTRDAPSAPPRGNVYQSNVAVYGFKGSYGCTVHDFLGYYKNPVDLDAHLDKVAAVSTKGALAPDDRYALYKELYVTPGFIERRGEEKIKQGFSKALTEGTLDHHEDTVGDLEVRRVTYANLETTHDNAAAQAIRAILGYNLPAQRESEEIYRTLA